MEHAVKNNGSISINRLTRRLGVLAAGVVCVTGVISAGCAGRPSLFPNSDESLRKTSTEFAVDAARRFPFKADAPQGGRAEARAQVAYMLKRVEIVNLSTEEWTNIEVWINHSYVVYIPKMESKQLKQFPFQMIYDENGHYFPTENNEKQGTLIKTLNIYRDGKMYDVPLQLAD